MVLLWLEFENYDNILRKPDWCHILVWHHLIYCGLQNHLAVVVLNSGFWNSKVSFLPFRLVEALFGIWILKIFFPFEWVQKKLFLTYWKNIYKLLVELKKINSNETHTSHWGMNKIS